MSRNPLIENADPSIFSTDAGIRIDPNNEHSEKASDSISETIEIASNTTE
jgi:hypothetical protein